MDNLDLVSILIPTYNRKKLVERAINSALKQTYKKIEIIISDNCSTDGTVEYLQELYGNNKNIKIFDNSTNKGPVRNWVNCIEQSSGYYSKLLFSDDSIRPNYIEETLKILKGSKDIGFVYTPVVIENKYKKNIFYKTFKTSKKIQSSKIEDRFLLDINVPVSPGAALFRKNDLLDSIKLSIQNPKNKDFNIYGAGTDLNIYLVLLQKYKFIYFSNKTMAYFYGYDSSLTIIHNLDYFYETVRFNFLKKKKLSLKKIVIYLSIKLKIYKIFRFCSPYLSKI
jgi:glycosyltransferase involved in cell wall biosynthesis